MGNSKRLRASAAIAVAAMAALTAAWLVVRSASMPPLATAHAMSSHAASELPTLNGGVTGAGTSVPDAGAALQGRESAPVQASPTF